MTLREVDLASVPNTAGGHRKGANLALSSMRATFGTVSSTSISTLHVDAAR